MKDFKLNILLKIDICVYFLKLKFIILNYLGRYYKTVQF